MLTHNKDYFLSSANPAATADQRDLERLAVEVSKTDTYKQGRVAAAKMWRMVMGDEAEEQDWSMFDDAMDEYAFNYALKAVNSDPNYPKVLSAIYAPAHEWFGEKIPGSRLGGDSPDNHYSFVPIDDAATFKIVGRQFSPIPANVTWQFSTDVMYSKSPKTVYASDFEYAEDGSFEITLGPEPANGRKNYIQLPERSRFLFIRESRSDWKQVPSAIRVTRITEPTAEPLTFEQIAERARIYMTEDVPKAYWFVRIARALLSNTMTAPVITGSMLGLHLQKISFGNLRIKKDEAYVVTVGSGNADFRDFVLMDIWYRSLENHNKRQSSMNNAQGHTSENGTTTYVISHRDPGVYNWLDAGGIVNLSPVHRWQGLPLEDDSDNPPFIEGKLVKFDQLDDHLPADTRRVTKEERRQQLDQRAKEYNLRWIDQ